MTKICNIGIKNFICVVDSPGGGCYTDGVSIEAAGIALPCDAYERREERL